MPKLQESIIRQMQELYTNINGVMEDPVLQGYAELHGYDGETMDSLLQKWEQVMDLVNEYGREYNEKLDATDQLHTRLEALEKQYKRHLELSRTRFKRAPEILDKLGALGERKRSQAGIMDQIREFYDTALNHTETQSGLNDINLSEEELQEGADEILSLFELKKQQEIEEGEAQRARVVRDEALDSLSEEVGDLVSYVTIEAKYNGEEPRLEKVGVLVRS